MIDPTQKNTRQNLSSSLLSYFLLVLVFSIPFWLIGPMMEHYFAEIPINLPVSALMFVCPLMAAVILIYKKNGSTGVKKLLTRAFDFHNIRPIWYLPIFLSYPLIMTLSYFWMKWAGFSIPSPKFPLLIVPVFFIVFFIAAIFEEVGWQGYAYDRLENRWNALSASIILGFICSIWHFIPLFQAGHSTKYVLWHGASIVLLRTLIVWVYNNTNKSVLSAVILHTMVNVSSFLFPIYGSYYNPTVTTCILAIAIVIITFLWGPKTLTRYRYAK